MLFGLTLFAISAVTIAGPVSLRSERQWQYRAGLGPNYWRAVIGSGLIVTSWLCLLMTFTLGATSVEPLVGLVLALGILGWITGVACGVAGLSLRRGDPAWADLTSLVLLWGGCAVDPYVREVLPTAPTLIVGGVVIAAVLAIRLLLRQRRSVPA